MLVGCCALFCVDLLVILWPHPHTQCWFYHSHCQVFHLRKSSHIYQFLFLDNIRGANWLILTADFHTWAHAHRDITDTVSEEICLERNAGCWDKVSWLIANSNHFKVFHSVSCLPLLHHRRYFSTSDASIPLTPPCPPSSHFLDDPNLDFSSQTPHAWNVWQGFIFFPKNKAPACWTHTAYDPQKFPKLKLRTALKIIKIWPTELQDVCAQIQ